MAKKQVEKSEHKHIRITDLAICDMIDKIMTLPQYKSFNKVINDALNFGMPLLIKHLFDNDNSIEMEMKKSDSAKTEITEVENINEEKLSEQFIRIIKLLEQISLNSQLNRWIVNSLFNEKVLELQGKRASSGEFKEGSYKSTPDCFYRWELNELAKSEDED